MEGEEMVMGTAGEAKHGAPGKSDGQKVWHVASIPGSFEEDDLAEVKVRRLDNSITVIAKRAIDEEYVTIVGSMLPATPKDEDNEKKFVEVPAALFTDQNSAEDTLFALRGKYKFTRTVGYLPTDQAGCYVRVVRRNLLLALIPIFAAAAIAAALILLQNGGIPGLTMDPNQTDPWDAQQATQQSKDTITVDGVSAIKVDSTHTSWPLKNPDVNTSYFKYTCTCDGATLFESEWIEPGKAVSFNIYEALGGRAGTYTVTINIATRDMNTHAEQNGATYDVEVTVY